MQKWGSNLPAGSEQKVLVPQVYVRVKPGDIDGSGALLSGNSVNLNLSGDLNNQGGTIAGRTTVALTADNSTTWPAASPARTWPWSRAPTSTTSAG